MRATAAVGRYGEKVAVDHLQRAGFVVLDRNWRCALGELDVVARDRDCVVAVEVKTRRSLRFGHPVEAVTARKLARLRRLTALWMREHDVHTALVRVDVMAVVVTGSGPAQVEHLRGVG